MTKRVIKIIIAVIILAVLIGVGFWIFSGNSDGTNSSGRSIRDFFPFGREPEPTLNTGGGAGTLDTGAGQDISQELPRLRQISENPMSGAFTYSDSFNTYVRFVDKATGHVFESDVDDPELIRLTNTTIPTIYEAVWAGENTAVLRYLQDNEEIIESVILRLIPPEEAEEAYVFTEDLEEGDRGKEVFNLQLVLNEDPDTQIAESGPGSPGNETILFGPATSEAVKKFQEKYSEDILKPQDLTEGTGVVDEFTRKKLNQITGASAEPLPDDNEGEELHKTSIIYLPDDIKSLAYISSLDKIFYLQEDKLGSIGTLIDKNNSTQSQIFDSAAKEWLVHKYNQNIIISAKATRDFPGVVYTLSQSGSLNKIIGGVAGLTAIVSPDTDKALFSNSNFDGFELKLYDKTQNLTSAIELTTMPEKCVWSEIESGVIYCAIPEDIPEGEYPDIWYQGLVSFEDNIWKIDTNTGKGSLIQEIDVSIDAIEPFLSSNEQYLFFTNKKDSQLWSLRLFDSQTEEEMNRSATSTATTTENN